MIVLPLVLRQLQRWDDRRSSVPGEHWAAFGTGIALLQVARTSRSPWLRVAAGVAGVAMVWRAANGRDGFLQQIRGEEEARTPEAVPAQRQLELNSPPH